VSCKPATVVKTYFVVLVWATASILLPRANAQPYLPTATWKQRYVQNGCGGECGSANLNNPTQSTGRTPVANGELALATTDRGHEGSQGATWIVDNPWAGIDFAYRGVHVTAQLRKLS
jgi:Tannase and feruloyl esterase